MFDYINKYKKRIAFIEKNKKIYYSELFQDIEKLKDYLKPRSLLLMICDNSYYSILVYLTSIKYKIVPILIDKNIDDQFLQEFIKIYEPDYVFGRNVQMLNENKFRKVKNYEDYHLYESKYQTKKLSDDLALIIPTSGSTGSSKFVMLSYKNLNSNTNSITSYLKLNKLDQSIFSLPFNYSYGLSILNTHISNGASLILEHSSPTQKEFWDTFKKHKKITNFSSVPLVFEFIKKFKINIFNFKNLKFCTVAGGHLGMENQKYFHNQFLRKKIRFYIMYGQTEASPRISYVRLSELKNNYGSIGRPISGGKFELINQRMYSSNKNHNVGELVYSGDNVFIGYCENKNDLNKVSKIKKLKTGDLAYKKNNNYYIIGRIKRIVKCSGIRINLDDLEKKLNFEFNDIILIGNDNNIVILTRKISQKLNIKQYMINKVKINPFFFKIVSIKKFPKLESGKIDYKLLSKSYG